MNDQQDRVETSDGYAIVTADVKCGQLVFLACNPNGGCSLLTLDRTHDKSADPYNDIFTKWANERPYPVVLLGVGELSKDDTDKLAVQYFIDDQSLAIVTTCGHSGAIPIYRWRQPETLWWLTMFHHAIQENTSVAQLQSQLAAIHLT